MNKEEIKKQIENLNQSLNELDNKELNESYKEKVNDFISKLYTGNFSLHKAVTEDYKHFYEITIQLRKNTPDIDPDAVSIVSLIKSQQTL